MADKVEGSLPENFLFLEEPSIFILFRLLTDWMRPTHIMESKLLYLKSTDRNANLIYKIPSQKHLECLNKYLGNMA